MIRISTTTLESYRRIVQTEYGDEAELIAAIQGKPFTPTWQMRAGTAWHTLLSCKDDLFTDDPDDVFDEGGFGFRADAIDQARVLIGPGQWEVKATKQLTDWHNEPVVIVAQADHVHGTTIIDVKTRFSPADPSDYDQSLQWRLYLLVHEAFCFRYVLCEFKEPKDGLYPEEGIGVREPSSVMELKDIVTTNFWPYLGMYQDCMDLLNDFLAWADRKNLLGYLRREGSSITAEAVS